MRPLPSVEDAHGPARVHPDTGDLPEMADIRRPTRIAGLVLALALGATACAAGNDPDAQTGNDNDELSGSITVSGSSTVEPITSLVAELFRDENPGVEITVDGPGTGDGFELFCQGETDISDASRQIKEPEAEACADAGVEYTELKVGIDGIAVLTNPSNEAVGCVSFSDIYGLVGPESEGLGNWSDAQPLAEEVASTVDGAPESKATFPDASLDIFAPGEESGTYDSFVELAIEDIAEAREQEAQTRPDYSANADDNVIVQGIAGSNSSFGWVGFAFFEENQGSLKALEVAGHDGTCVEATPDTIASGEYPLSRPLFIYVNNAAAEDSEALTQFIDFYLSDTGLEAVKEVGYVQLTDDDWGNTKTAWSDRG